MATPFSSQADFAQAARALMEGEWASTREDDGGSGEGSNTRPAAPSLLRAGNDVGWSWRQPAGPYGKGYLVRSQVVRPKRPSAASKTPTESSSGTLGNPLALALQGGVDNRDEDADPATASAMPALELMQLTHHIVFSPTYRVPQLLLSAHSLSSGAPTPLAVLLASALVRPPTSVAVSADEHGAIHLPAEELGGADFPLLSLAEHPATGETVWALHPCHLADAVDEILAADAAVQDGEADAVLERVAQASLSSARWLQTWLMVVGSVVDLRWWSG